MRFLLAGLLFASVLVVGCGEKTEESIAPDAAALKDVKPAAPKGSEGGGGMPQASPSGLDPTK